MEEILPDLIRRIDRVAANRESGAAELLTDVLAILTDALRTGQPMRPIARAVCRAQPAMAPLWNAALLAAAPENAADRLERFARRAARAQPAIDRFAATALESAAHLVTLSSSSTVARVFDALRHQQPIRVSCSESRPGCEGRRLATRLSAAGIAVTCYADAALGHALDTADAVVVGADAVAARWFMNKSGTHMLAAMAAQQGVPLYVVAGRDKLVPAAIAARLEGRSGAPAEVWDAPPTGVDVANPYFESTPIELVTGIISDAGVLAADMVAEACAAADEPWMRQLLAGV
jgi:translation initiation factor eIF-2B subunit delta